MATIGSTLSTPETGWKRIDSNSTDAKFNFIGSGWFTSEHNSYYNGNSIVSPVAGDKCIFYIKSNKLRIISGMNTDRPTKIYIKFNDDDNQIYTFSGYANLTYCCLEYENLNLDIYNKVELWKDTTQGGYLSIDAIDIDENGSMITEDEYNKIISFNCLIYDDGKYKNYDKTNDELIEVTDVDTILNNYEGIRIYNLNLLIPHLSELSNGWKLISNKSFTVKVNGIKTTSSMICTLEPVSMKKFETIHSITGDYTIENNGAIKLIFSFDKGQTWKTYDVSNSVWNDVSVNIPIKLYENFTDEDKTNWNNARDTILSDGISVQNLGNVDFQSVKTDKLMFAVAFNRPSYADTCTLKGLNINYDGLETYIQLACGSDLNKYEATISITGDSVEVKTASNQNKILVTMTTNI